jgi:hypothetical protein
LGCAKLHVYYQECFANSHRSDSKKLHKTQLLAAQENLEEILFCPIHKKKLKEYACLTCNTAICADCSIIGTHKKHEIDSIQKGYEKIVIERVFLLAAHKEEVVGEFKTRAAGYDNLLKLSEDKINGIVSYLNATVELVKLAKKQVMDYLQILIKVIERKTAKTLDIIDNEVNGLLKDIEVVQESKDMLKKNIEYCKESVEKVNVANFEVYHKFIKSNEKIEKAKNVFDRWLLLFLAVIRLYLTCSRTCSNICR